MYIHQLSDWPRFHWDSDILSDQLAIVRYRQGRFLGQMESLGFSLRSDAHLQTLTQDVIKSSEIEGEVLDKNQVRSSIARRLGMDIGGMTPTDRNVEGVVEMMLDATWNYNELLNKKRLFKWHESLFPSGYSGLRKIRVGSWRNDEKGPMQVISGPIGHEQVHYEAPSADRLEDEMATFLNWFNSNDGTDLVLRSFTAHLWFVTIHPFDDGNGRIARALSDMLLARSEQSNQRFYSMSSQIRNEREDYYNVLENAQKGTLDITEPLEWFLRCMNHAFDNVEVMLANVLRKMRFWSSCTDFSFNDRQKLVINKLLDDFVGKLTSTKWAKLARCSQDTASRDINDLVCHGILIKNQAGGRSTSYSLMI